MQVIAVDTNVLVRYILQDDPQQSDQVNRLMESVSVEENPALINHLVLCETIWVFQRHYGFQKAELIALLKTILSVEGFVIQGSFLVWQAIYDFEEGQADFSDYLLAHINKSLGAKVTVSFDKKALKHEFFKEVDNL